MKNKAYFINRLISLDPSLDPNELTQMTVVKLLELIRVKRNPPPPPLPEDGVEEEEYPDLASSILGCHY